MSEWIKCSERLPTNKDRIGYVFNGKEIRDDVVYPGYCGSWEYDNNLGYAVKIEGITHWYPRPNPPEI